MIKDLIATHSHGNLTNKTVFHCLYCTHQFSEKRLRLKHMVACQLAPKHLTKKKLFEISQTYESSSISSQCSNLVNNVDDEISISNGVICQVNQTLQNKHLNGTGKFVGDRNPLRIPYQNHLKVDHAIDLKSKPDTPVRSSTTYSLNNPDNLLVRNPHPFIDISSFNDICTKPSEGHLFSGNNQLYESDENIWRNYRPSYNGPYTCSFCYRVIHNRSNFARHMAACKTRISLSTSYTPSPKTSSRKNKHKCHFMFKSSHKVKSQSENLKKQSSRSRKLHTELSEVNQDLNADLDSNENVVNSEEKLQDVSDLSLFDKEVAGLRDSEGSQRGCIEEVPIVTEFHENDSTEDGQENRMSPLRTGEPDASTTSLLVVNEQNVFNVNGTPNVFTCFTCSSSYRHRASLLRHGRVSRHKVDPDLNADMDSNENVVNSEEKLQDVSDLSLFDKEVAGLRDSEGSQRGCIEEVPIVTEFHENDSTEDGQENRMSPSRTGEPDASTTSLLVVNEQNVFNVNGTPNVFTCFTCSSSYRHRASLLRHGRVSRHKVDPDLNADMDSNENVVNSEEKLQDVSDLSLLDKEVAGLRDSEGSQRGCIEEVPIVTEFHENDSTEVDPDLNADMDSNENVVNSEEKLQDVSDLSLFDKEVAGLRDSEGSQRGCIEEVPIVTEFHENDSTEDGQENRMSPSRTGEPDASTTSLLVVNEQNVFNVNGTPNVFTCFTCSSSYRHRASLLRHGRVSRHKVDPDLNADMDSNENVVNSEEKLQDVSDLSLLDKEVAGLRDSEGSQRGCIEEVPIVTEFHENDSTEDGQENRMSPSRTGEPDASTTSLLVVNEQNVFNVNGTPNVFTCFTCSSSYRHRASLLRHGRVSRHKVDNCRILNGTRVVSIVCPVNGSKDCLKGRSVKNRVLSNLCAKKCGQSESLDRGVDDRQQNAHLSEVHNTDNYSLASEISTKPSKTASYTSSSSDIMDEPLKIDHASNRSADKSMRASEFVNCLTTGVLKVKQTSEMNPLTSNPTMLTGKPYSLGLRRRLSVQSDQSTPITSKLNRRENRSASPYSLRHPRIEEEISKCSRRSSVSTQSLSDNLIDDVKSIISNATTIPASDHNFKNIVPPPSVVFTCSWCNRTGFKCFRYLQIHRARCSSRPSWLNKQKPVLSTNNNKKIKTPTICEQCHREFRSIHGLKVHQNLGCHKKSIHIHDEASLFSSSSSQSMACPGCPPNALLFESTDQLLKHLLTLKSSTGSNHTNRSQYWPTVLSVPNLGYGCHICGILLASESRLDKHKKACHEAWLFEEQQNISPNKRFSNS
ncbi:Zinc finger C2H2 [Schistosoma japonicum]|nr:Zinc finger C2H2 [Schistosoma japonicum]